MRALASLKLTAAGLLLLAAGIGWAYVTEEHGVFAIASPMLLLAANLAAAIVVNPAFRRQAPLLAFHIALLALAVLVAAGRLSYLNGRVELATGEEFAPAQLESDRGPLHYSRLERVSFMNEGFEIDYAPQWKRMETRNRVRWRDAQGVEQAGVIGDQTPLVLEGYRFYTTWNKGFAPVFVWQPLRGEASRGTVHLPSYPIRQFGQQALWTPPGTREQISVKLPLDSELIDFDNPAAFRLPAQHHLEITHEGKVHVVAPGDSIALRGGRLRYEALTTWMGYLVVSDWTLPWLLAASVFAALALAWHFWRRFFARPWAATEAQEEQAHA